MSFPSFLEKGWRLGTNRQWGESPHAQSLTPLRLLTRFGVYHLSQSSLCSFLLRLPFFPILLTVLTGNEATGRALVSLVAEVRI